MFACNTAVQATTKFGPFHLFYEVDSAAIIDTVFPYMPLSDNIPVVEATCPSDECQQCRDASSGEAELRRASTACEIPGRAIGLATGSRTEPRSLCKALLSVRWSTPNSTPVVPCYIHG